MPGQTSESSVAASAGPDAEAGLAGGVEGEGADSIIDTITEAVGSIISSVFSSGD